MFDKTFWKIIGVFSLLSLLIVILSTVFVISLHYALPYWVDYFRSL